MGHALDIQLLRHHGFLRSRCDEKALRRRCPTCGCDLVSLGDSLSGCPACLTEERASHSACQRCGVGVDSEGFRACRSAAAYAAEASRGIAAPSDTDRARAFAGSPRARPAFAPASRLAQVSWNGGSRRCIIEHERVRAWAAAGILTTDARVLLEGAPREELVSEQTDCQDWFPDPSLPVMPAPDGLTDPSRWPDAGRALLQATMDMPPFDSSGAPRSTAPDLPLPISMDGLPQALRELAQPSGSAGGAKRDLVAVAIQGWNKNGGDPMSAAGAVIGAIVSLAASALRTEFLERWYGARRIDEARAALAAEHERLRVFAARRETALAAWRALTATRAIAEAEAAAARARLVTCREALALRLAAFPEPLDDDSRRLVRRAEAAALGTIRLDQVRLRGIGKRRLSVLSSAGIHTAADIDAARLEGIAKIGRSESSTLIAWRDECLGRIRAEPPIVEAVSDRARIETFRSIEAAVDVRAAWIRCLHSRQVGLAKVARAEQEYEDALRRAKESLPRRISP